MRLLCFDLSTGGISAALFDSQLESAGSAEEDWTLEPGAATLPVSAVLNGVKRAIAGLRLTEPEEVEAICIGTFMHNCVLLDDAGTPLTPLFTWLDQRGESGLEYVRSRLGERFHAQTGCRYHPMFPVFKIAAMRLEDEPAIRNMRRVVSIKAVLVHALTGSWCEDHGLASASGLFNIHDGGWDREILALLDLDRDCLPPIASRTTVVGTVTAEAAAQFGLEAGTPVVLGSGDGFLANVGCECEGSDRIAVSLGTSAVARQTLTAPVLDASGTFCYRADAGGVFLLGCAGSNGGNVLDWGRRIFGNAADREAGEDAPIFIPLLHGERSPDWNPRLTGSWHGLTARHTAADLWASIVEGVVFNLAHFVEIIQNSSGKKAAQLVVSGNGFRQAGAAPMLAQTSGVSVWMPESPGLASLRGAAVCALRALGRHLPPLKMEEVRPATDAKVLDRYREYRRLREALI
jgi:gluconokinase